MSRTQYQFIAGGRRTPTSCAPGCRGWSSGCAGLAELADVASDQQDRRPAGLRGDRSRRREPLGITPALIDNALYNAFGQRIVSTIFTQTNQYRVVLEVLPEFRKGVARARQHLRHRSTARCRAGTAAPADAGSAVGAGAGDRARGAARDQPHRPVSGRDDFVQPGARRVAGRRGGRRSRPRSATSACRPASRCSFQGAALAFRASLDEPAAADPRRHRHGLHRAGRALRELHPPDHDPVDAALGRRRRAAGAACLPATISASSRSSASSC